MKKEELIKTVQDAVEEAYKAGYAEGIKDGNINDGTFAKKVNEAYKNGYTKGKEEHGCVVISQLRADRDRLATSLDEIRAEIERQEKWLMDAGYNAYNIDIAFDSIRKAIEKGEE